MRCGGEIVAAYRRLEAQYGANVAVAVRSSATAEDLPTASFAGQHESYLNISGDDDVFEACRQCFASLFTNRAIVYRVNNGFDHFKVGLSVGVMKMVRSDRAASGVIFTLDTESGFRDVVFITGSYGLGENVVQGTVDPDEFYVHKPMFRAGHRCVLRRTLGQKQLTMTLAKGHTGSSTRNEATPQEKQSQFCLTDEEALTLADYALKIEAHYSKHAGHAMPMDIEWAKDADDSQLYIVQARPETVASRKSATMLETYSLKGSGRRARYGQGGRRENRRRRRARHPGRRRPQDFPARRGAGGALDQPRLGAGDEDRRRHRHRSRRANLSRGDRRARARRSRDRRHGKRDGRPEDRRAGDDLLRRRRSREPSTKAKFRSKSRASTSAISSCRRRRSWRTSAIPTWRSATAMTPNAGVGLARMEFIINEHIGVHPMALAHPERIEAEERAQIAERARAFASPREYFVRNLAEGVGTIAAAFYPKPVIIRLSDFKTNEYAALLGGAAFEPREANPMLGFRGASRYAHPAYADGFALECEALRRVRDVMGLTNLLIMVPFCRRVVEAEQVLAAMARNGLKRGENGLEIYVMCEIPNNVIQVDAFAKVFDGFSIGSNDLTQLTLGVDRDSDIVAFDFDERDPGMLEMLRLAVGGAKRNGRKVGICGEAPANYPEIARFLAKLGIDSISVNPASLLRTIDIVREAEAAG